MSRLDDVLATLQTAIQQAIIASDAPGSSKTRNGKAFTINTNGQVLVGEPDGPELVKIMAKGFGQWQVTIAASLAAQADVMFRPTMRVKTPPVVTMTAAVVNNTITLGGTFAAGLNLHAVINRSDALAQTTTGGSIAATATTLAAKISLIPGVAASAIGNVITVTGAHSIVCNIGGSGVLTREVNRLKRTVLVSVWASDPVTRSAIQEPIETKVGNVLTQWIRLPDGAALNAKCLGEVWQDGSQSQYGVLHSVICFACRYGIMEDLPAVQIGAGESSIRVNNGSPVTAFSGGV
jgi:hypothetical protein